MDARYGGIAAPRGVRPQSPLRVLILAAIVAFAVAIAIAVDDGHAQASHVSCGATITTDTTVDSDLLDCPNNGIVIGADDITLDLNGHTIDGDGMPAAGCDLQTEFCDVAVANDGHDGVTVMDGSMREFGAAVNIFGPVQHNRLLDVSASRSADVGIQLFKSSKSVIRGSSASGSPNRHHLGFGLALYSSHHLRIVGNSFRHNTGDGLHTVDSNSNLFTRNRVAHNGGEGFVLEGGESNEIRRNRFVQNGGTGITFDPGSHNVIVRNRVTGGRDGIRVAKGRGNLIAHNTVVGTARAGIRLGLTNPLLGGSHNTVRRNLVRDSRHDGFVVMSKDGHSLLRHNTARAAGDDGFDVHSRSTKLTRNRAVRNGDLGIKAVKGVTDGGGNAARKNGDRRECKHVRCK